MGAEPQGGDPPADIFRPRFEAAFDAHHVDVLAFACRRVSDRAAAEDVVAETFAVVWRKRDLIPDSPLPWLYAIARRVIANQRRAEQRRGRLRACLSTEARAGSESQDPARLVVGREAVLAAFARLSEPNREILRLVAWDQLDTKAAAQILGCSPAAFRVRLHRARRELKRALEVGSAASEYESAAPPGETAEEAR